MIWKSLTTAALRSTETQREAKIALHSCLAACSFGFILVSATSGFAKPTEIVVALDGSGNFKGIQEAIMSVPAATGKRIICLTNPERVAE